uniref:Sugar phosphate exchanger putative n=1 Tax=Albugo laibachii Nc14 TaxID=890382 RepID=F0WE81_9STRA|nr:sugar phosphate exchanger putative [Albugo laibachii Nc14]|eukprot:CCA19510.1 sugar phosphate exchanger putative [Albugo laibachii Nc14]
MTTNMMKWMKTKAATKPGVFFLTFFSFVFFHFGRKSFAAMKGELSAESWMESSFYSKDDQAKMFGWMDTVFMLTYAAGLYASGFLGDRYDLRKMITIGMLSTSMILVCFGIGAFAGLHSYWYYLVLWALNGMAQASGFPSNVAVMGKWFSRKERGAILGIWSGNASLGNVLGAAFVALMFYVFEKSIAWKIALMAMALIVAAYAMLIYVFLVPDPKSPLTRHLIMDHVKPGSPGSDEEEVQSSVAKPGISFWKAWLIPGVIWYALSFACLKSVNYTLFSWLPFYLNNSLRMDNAKAASYSMLYDVGQIIGGCVGGYISDKIGARSPVIAVMLLLSCVTINYFPQATRLTIIFLLLAAGVMIGGPTNLIATAISADLGLHESIKRDSTALATVTGIIDGSGSLGAALAQLLVGHLSDCHHEPKGCHHTDPDCKNICHWDPVFVGLQVAPVLACLFLTQLLYREYRVIQSRPEEEKFLRKGCARMFCRNRHNIA